MRLFAEENQLVVENDDNAVQSRAEQGEASQRKDHFYDFLSDDEGSTPTDSVEVEAANYLSTAKELDCLHKYPIIKSLFLSITPHYLLVFLWRDCLVWAAWC